ncbi:spermidine synthase [Corynebacterium vitaeruminis]|uniref:spermidine synthase n=1 Tax=Corynebacterium vitaeruminis TaxID=38305 RepID=UPI00046CF440|nr:fused MFS/spermidine synthase [Corynebacterium vitaeruminis]
MSRKRRGSNRAGAGTAGSPASKTPEVGLYPTATGSVELRQDPYSPGGHEVFVNGVPSSHIAADPLELAYEYMRWIALSVEAFVPGRLDPTRLRITHLGGGACTLARYFAARYPQSRNTVVELDGTLVELARAWFDLPKAPRLKIRQGDARAVTDTFVPASRDVIIRDVFAGATTPPSLITVEFFARCAEALSGSGLYVANCGDHPDLRLARSELAGMREVFGHVACIADPAMLKGRRYGNIILLGSNAPLPTGNDAARLRHELLGGAVPAHYEEGSWVAAFSSSGIALHDASGTEPAP